MDVHSFALPGSTEHYAADRPVSAQHLRLEVALDFKDKAVTGICTTRLRAVRDVKTISFDAVDLEVQRVDVGNKRATFSNSGTQLRVELPTTLRAGSSVEVSIRYRARPRRGLYFWAPDQGYPDRPIQAWTQGQDEDSRAWFPCLDAPAQKATSEVIATFPGQMTSVSNGTLVSERRRGAKRTMHYRLDLPHSPYLVTLVVGEFEEVRDRVGETEVRYLFPKGRKADAMRCVQRTPEMIRHFESITGEKYPFKSYTQVFVADFIFGGMENTSATTLTDTVLHDARAHLDYSAESLVSHELAHQWFGDLLTCREWPHGWLNEGFATYCEVLWKEKAEGTDEADQTRREDLEAYLEEARERYARPIVSRRYHLPIDLFDRHLYQKGALVLHELRRRLGDELFFRAIRHYVDKNRNQNVETVDLARAIEAATGHNVDQFFSQYVFSPGHPQLRVDVRYEPEPRRLRLKVMQTQKTGEPDGFPLYRLPLEVRWVSGGQTRTQQLQVVDAEHVYFLPCPKEPTQVVVDPRREVLGTLQVDQPEGHWLEQLLRAKEARARADAASALGKSGSPRAVDALARSLAKDAFWATQAACAKALGMTRSPAAKSALLKNVEIRSPKVRRAVVAALGEFIRDAEVGDALKRICKKGDASYFVEGEAARSLGKLRLTDALPILQLVAKRRSFMAVVAAGAIEGMASTLEPAAFEIVQPLTRYGQAVFIRRAAVKAVAKLAETAQKKREVIALLTELLRDPTFRIQLAAIESAVDLGDQRMIPALESTPFIDGRTQRAAREAVRALHELRGHAPELSALREEVDRLKEETRGLKEQLENLNARRLARD